jgi:hypothetical protein
MNMEEASVNPSDQEAARALVSQHPLLREDDYTKRVIETGIADNGKPVDIGDFLAARGAILEMDAVREKNPDAYDAAVVHSKRPDLENWVN